MPDYCFYKKGKNTVVVERSDSDSAEHLTRRGFEKQFEEIKASDEKQALARLADIQREKRIDQHNFISGAMTMPFIGVLTAVANLFFRKK